VLIAAVLGLLPFPLQNTSCLLKRQLVEQVRQAGPSLMLGQTGQSGLAEHLGHAGLSLLLGHVGQAGPRLLL